VDLVGAVALGYQLVSRRSHELRQRFRLRGFRRRGRECARFSALAPGPQQLRLAPQAQRAAGPD